MLLAGGAVAFASQSIGKGHGTDAPNMPPPAPPALTVLPAATAVTRSGSIDLTAVAPANLRRDQNYAVHVYVNSHSTERIAMPDTNQFTLSNVPLDEGVNSIQASIVGDGGEGPLSAAVAVTRDDIAPTIKIVQPTDTVYTDNVTLLGNTEPGADIQITDGAGHEVASSVSADGRFSAALSLHVGDNGLTLHSTDAAGNHATSRVTIVRASSAASIALTVTPTDVFAADLPATVELTAVVHDELGRPVADGTSVVFGVSPPNRATATYTETTTNGRARVTNLSVDPGGATGSWLVTALATLPAGTELRADAPINVVAGAPKSPGQH